MSEFPFGYVPIHPSTWAYLSSLLMLGLFLKFNRFWSVRNLDLLLLVLLAPGLLMVHFGAEARLRAEASLGEQHQQRLDESPPVPQPPGPVAQGATVPSIEVAAAELDLAVPPLPTGRQSAMVALIAPLLPAVLIEAGWQDPTDTLQTDTLQDVAPEQEVTAEAAVPQPPNGSLPVERSDQWLADVQLERQQAQRMERQGYIWLFVIGALLLIRVLVDPAMKRRPLLEPNLTPGGLGFIGCSLMIFLFANVIVSQPVAEDLYGPRSAARMVAGQADHVGDDTQLRRHGPGYALFHLLPVFPTFVHDSRAVAGDVADDEPRPIYIAIAKAMAILGQLAIVGGILWIGLRDFNNLRMGVGMATIYLMLPYTAMMTGRVEHILPAALLVLAVASYRRPFAAGLCIGMASGVAYYPLFLLPLWFSFYWERGRGRFAIGLATSIFLAIGSLALAAPDAAAFTAQLQSMFGFWLPRIEGLEGIWALGWDPWFRLPILVGFVALCITFAIWPAEKNLGVLISGSCAVMVAVQFWNGFGGGLYMAWYLPLALLTFFRPNLSDRIALQVVRPAAWRPGKHWSIRSQTATTSPA